MYVSFRCNECERLFDSLMLLEHHKEEYEHWSSSEEDEDIEEEEEEDEFAEVRLDNALQMLQRNRQLKQMESNFEQETVFGPEDKTLLL